MAAPLQGDRMKGNAKRSYKARVRSSERISPSCGVIVFERPEGFPDALPGQFVSVRVSDSTVPLLRRPYSIMDLTGLELALLVKVAGRGSAMLASAGPGDVMDLAGPLGGSSFADPGREDAVLVAGGTGLAPMIHAARTWKRRGGRGRLYLVHGAASQGESPDTSFDADFDMAFRATMDGSAGFSGDVVTLLAKLLDEGRISAPLLYSCGPAGMVRALVERTGGRFKSHHTSLEAVMACGVGACRGCTVPLREGGRIVFKAVCDDGTVFRASDIAWEEWW